MPWFTSASTCQLSRSWTYYAVVHECFYLSAIQIMDILCSGSRVLPVSHPDHGHTMLWFTSASTCQPSRSWTYYAVVHECFYLSAFQIMDILCRGSRVLLPVSLPDHGHTMPWFTSDACQPSRSWANYAVVHECFYLSAFQIRAPQAVCAFHKTFASAVAVRRPNIWVYLRVLKDQQALSEKAVRRAQRVGGITGRRHSGSAAQRVGGTAGRRHNGSTAQRVGGITGTSRITIQVLAQFSRVKHPWVTNPIHNFRLHHPYFLYIGSSVNLCHRWANHKSDCKLRKGHKCHVAQHFLDKQHPVDPQFTCLRIFAIEAVHKKENLGKRETWWQVNVGTIFLGLNIRSDISALVRNRSRVQY
ncbi:hypothetical protein ACOMHN_042766 [Nucella lapillus]